MFQCPLCGKEFRHDDEYEPMCTGPDWTDDHEPTVMEFRRVDSKKLTK